MVGGETRKNPKRTSLPDVRLNVKKRHRNIQKSGKGVEGPKIVKSFLLEISHKDFRYLFSDTSVEEGVLEEEGTGGTYLLVFTHSVCTSSGTLSGGSSRV